MASPASIGKHPIHPMLIALPIGLWVFSFVADLIYFSTRDATWSKTAYYCLAGGIIGALLAAVPGMIDLLSARGPRIIRVGAWHAMLNVSALIVFAFSFYYRAGPAPDLTTPFILSCVGVSLIGMSGWLGGEMVYVMGMAVDLPGLEARRERHISERERRAA